MNQTMKAYMCWNEDMIDRVMDPDALEIAEHIFLATHHPIKMYRETATDTTVSSKIEFDEEGFLKGFLKAPHYIFSTILGEAGTGKTHLIRWIHSNLPSTEKRRVILIPRSGINLKRILEMILEGVEGPQFDQYRQKISSASENLTQERARETLLNYIALAIGPNGAHGKQNLSEMEEYFVESLPDLFHDVFFRKILLREGQIIDQLVEHILGKNEKTLRLETRREFTDVDLPLQVRDIAKASHAAQEIYAALNDSELKEAAIKWINKNLNEAITQMLSLRGADLVNLMTDIREELGKKGIELVILIEDFAMLQGIDFQLLDALLVRPNQHSRKLCNLRVAMACTSGYFQTLPDTVQHRVELRVSLDVQADESLFTKADIDMFVGRYMNALRYHNTELIRWYEQNLELDSPDLLPSKCVDCPLIDKCHSSFGSSGGFGLYPFNSDALHVMYKRLNSTETPSFNPRILIKDILKQTLANYGYHIKDGTFPPKALIQLFGGKTKNRLNALKNNELQKLDPTHSERREVLLELWSTTKDIIDLHPGIHEAFSIPELQIGGGTVPDEPVIVFTPEPEKTKKVPKVQVNPEPENALPQKVQDQVNLIENWKNGGKLPQTLAQDLREHLYEAINSYIDWNTEFLSEPWFKKDLWKVKGINFHEQATVIQKSLIQIVLPLEKDGLVDTSIVLTGILLYKHNKHWNFKEGKTYFRYFAIYIEKWSKNILQQIKELKANEKDVFNPVPFAVEVLAIGAALNGKLDKESLQKQTNELLSKSLASGPSYSDDWNKVQGELIKTQKDIHDILLARIACTKGDSQDYKIIDASQFIEPLQTLLTQGKLTLDLNMEHSEFKHLKKTYQYLQKTIPVFIEKERNVKEQQLAMLKSAFGEESSLTEIKAELKRAIDFSVQEGCYVGPDRMSLVQSITQLEEDKLKECMNNLTTLSQDGKLIDLLNQLGKLDHVFLSNSISILQQVSEFLQKTSTVLERDISDLSTQQGTQQLDRVKKEIEANFEELNKMLDVMQGSEVHVK
ncbi:protein DpdH [Neobacillus pocheonensis]|uniref:protein DpdH n=1 Tax=Neobacillus pocheonensis TaxID=363869 RepID=UPI003D29D9CB